MAADSIRAVSNLPSLDWDTHGCGRLRVVIASIRETAVAIATCLLIASLEWGSACAASAIRNEPGDPYNRPVRLPRPHMICVIGVTNPPQRICPARLAPPLSLCECFGADVVGQRYFVRELRRLPTVFSFDGYAW